jgi:parallel beta-helix repeat protein
MKLHMALPFLSYAMAGLVGAIIMCVFWYITGLAIEQSPKLNIQDTLPQNQLTAAEIAKEIVKNLPAQTQETAIDKHLNEPTGRGVRVRNSTGGKISVSINGGVKTGISIEGSSDVNIKDSNINKTKTGIEVKDSPRTGVENNIVKDTDTAIRIERSPDSSVKKNRIEGSKD